MGSLSPPPVLQTLLPWYTPPPSSQGHLYLPWFWYRNGSVCTEGMSSRAPLRAGLSLSQGREWSLSPDPETPNTVPMWHWGQSSSCCLQLCSQAQSALKTKEGKHRKSSQNRRGFSFSGACPLFWAVFSSGPILGCLTSSPWVLPGLAEPPQPPELGAAPVIPAALTAGVCAFPGTLYQRMVISEHSLPSAPFPYQEK